MNGRRWRKREGGKKRGTERIKRQTDNGWNIWEYPRITDVFFCLILSSRAWKRGLVNKIHWIVCRVWNVYLSSAFAKAQTVFLQKIFFLLFGHHLLAGVSPTTCVSPPLPPPRLLLCQVGNPDWHFWFQSIKASVEPIAVTYSFTWMAQLPRAPSSHSVLFKSHFCLCLGHDFRWLLKMGANAKITRIFISYKQTHNYTYTIWHTPYNNKTETKGTTQNTFLLCWQRLWKAFCNTGLGFQSLLQVHN